MDYVHRVNYSTTPDTSGSYTQCTAHCDKLQDSPSQQMCQEICLTHQMEDPYAYSALKK